MKLDSGEIVAERYSLDQCLGEGTFGEVWSAWDSRFIQRRVAIKFLKPEYSAKPEIVMRFEGEADALALLHHPNVITVMDRGELGNRRFIVMEFLEGKTLEGIIEAHHATTPLDLGSIRTIIDQVCAGVGAAHDIRVPGPIVHRDIKPGNIIVSIAQSGETFVKVLDFGIAQLGERNLTRSGARMGTPVYMAPEQGLGAAASVSPASDVFSLGVLLLELLSGDAISGDGDLWWGAVLKGKSPDFDRVFARYPALPIGVRDAIVRSLNPDADARFQSAGALREAIATAFRQGRESSPPSLPPLVAETTAKARPTARRRAPEAWAATVVDPTFQPWSDDVVPSSPEVRTAVTTEVSAPPSIQDSRDAPKVSAARSVKRSSVWLLVPLTLAVLTIVIGVTWKSESESQLQSNPAVVPSVPAPVAPPVVPPTVPLAPPATCLSGAIEACLGEGDAAETRHDYPTAERCYQMACEHHIALGCNGVAWLHHGHGFPTDLPVAERYYALACQEGYARGCTSRGVIRQEARDWTSAQQQFAWSCGHGDAYGCTNLGYLYQSGHGVRRDRRRAVELFRQGCSGGDPNGCNQL